MTIAALVGLYMDLVAEFHLACILDLVGHVFSRVALAATGQRERNFTVVAGSARLTFFHFGHCHPFIIAAGCVESGMAGAAWVLGNMLCMTEGEGTGFFDLECYVLNGVATGTILDAECVLTVAGTAGLPLFHVCHGVAGFFLHIEDSIVAGLAIVVDAGLLDVEIVVKHHFACVCRVVRYGFDGDGMGAYSH